VYAFVHIDKTGGRTVRAVLRNSLGTGHCEIRTPYARRPADPNDRSVWVTAADLHRVRRIYRGLRGIAGHNVKPCSDLQAEAPDLRYFTFLRDPVKRWLSHYKNKAGSYGREDFAHWADAEWTHDFQTRTLTGGADAARAIELLERQVGFVGLTEAFDESLLMLGQWLGEPRYRAEYRAVNQLADKSRRRDETRARTDLAYLEEPAVRARLAGINAVDQQVYDWAVRERFARQRAAYRGDLAADLAELRRRNAALTEWDEPLSSRLLRNWVYKPALVLRLA
jgi:hypothetical protein